MALVTTFMTTPLLKLVYPTPELWQEFTAAKTARTA
jgi:hypothetical protein